MLLLKTIFFLLLDCKWWLEPVKQLTQVFSMLQKKFIKKKELELFGKVRLREFSVRLHNSESLCSHTKFCKDCFTSILAEREL